VAAHHRASGFGKTFRWNPEDDVTSENDIGHGQRLRADALDDQEKHNPAEVFQKTLRRDGSGEPAQQAADAMIELAEAEEAVSANVEPAPDVGREKDDCRKLSANRTQRGPAHAQGGTAELSEDEDV